MRSLSETSNDLVNSNAKLLGNSLQEFINSARNATLITEDYNLLEAGKRLVQSIDEVLKTSRDIRENPNSLPLKKKLRKAMKAMQGSSYFLNSAVKGELTDPASEQLILEIAQNCQNEIKKFGDHAIELAPRSGNNELNMAQFAKKVIFTADALLERSKILAPLTIDHENKIALLEEIQKAKIDTIKLMTIAENSELPKTDIQTLKNMEQTIQSHLCQLANATNLASSRIAKDQEQLTECSRKLDGFLAELQNSVGKPALIKKNAEAIAFQVPQLLQVIKSIAMVNPQNKENLFSQAKEIASNTQSVMKLIEPAMKNPESFVKMLTAANKLQKAVHNVFSDLKDIPATPFTIVRMEGKNVVATSTGLLNTAKEVLSEIKDPEKKNLLAKAIEKAQNSVNQLTDSLTISALDLIKKARSEMSNHNNDDDLNLLKAAGGVSEEVKKLLSTKHEGNFLQTNLVNFFLNIFNKFFLMVVYFR